MNQYFICRGERFKLGKRTYIMGILNLTPDSFSNDGYYVNKRNIVNLKSNKTDIKKIIKSAQQMVDSGANILDIGGESSRPGAKPITVEEENKRLLPVLKELVKKINIPISVDTYKYEVAKICLEEGAAIINDITAFNGDIRMASLIAKYKAGVILMHMKNTPQTMQKAPRYGNLISEIKSSLKKSIKIALDAGIKKSNIIIDPGIGFGKTLNHNLEILKNIDVFKKMGYGVLLGTSRKSMIGIILDKPVNQRIMGTAATVAVSICKGADFVRVHDVKEMAELVKVTDAIIR